jgi:cytoskeleton protein RodZ
MMEELLDNNAGHNDRAAALPAISIGKTLREARERLGLSVADVSSQIKFVSRQIEALEADDFQHLPEMTFLRGFVRCYAKLLHLDAQVLLAALPQTPAVPVQLMPASVEVPFPRAHSQQLQNLLWSAAALLLAVPAVLFAVWHYTTPPEQPEVAQVETQVTLPAEMQIVPASPVAEASVMAASLVAAAATPPVAPVATSTVAPVAPPVVAALPIPMPAKPAVQPVQPTVLAAKPPVQPAQTQAASVKPVAAASITPQAAALRLVFEADSWTEIRERNDKIISSQVNLRGSELRLDGHAPFTLVIGHAVSARLYYRGKQVDLKPYTNAYSEVARVTLE